MFVTYVQQTQRYQLFQNYRRLLADNKCSRPVMLREKPSRIYEDLREYGQIVCDSRQEGIYLCIQLSPGIEEHTGLSQPRGGGFVYQEIQRYIFLWN